MLVLSRKVGQRLVIGDNITVVINRIAGNRVTLGIEAPDDVHIMRGELEKQRSEFGPPVAAGGPATLPFTFEVELDDMTSCLPRLAR